MTAGALATTLGLDSVVHLPSGSTPSNNVARRTVPADDDPKATRSLADITYQLDPVDDLPPGTYVASVEIGDRGRKSATDSKTPSVAVVTFQVKTATPEKPVARDCEAADVGPDADRSVERRRGGVLPGVPLAA